MPKGTISMAARAKVPVHRTPRGAAEATCLVVEIVTVVVSASEVGTVKVVGLGVHVEADGRQEHESVICPANPGSALKLRLNDAAPPAAIVTGGM